MHVFRRHRTCTCFCVCFVEGRPIGEMRSVQYLGKCHRLNMGCACLMVSAMQEAALPLTSLGESCVRTIGTGAGMPGFAKDARAHSEHRPRVCIWRAHISCRTHLLRHVAQTPWRRNDDMHRVVQPKNIVLQARAARAHHDLQAQVFSQVSAHLLTRGRKARRG